MVNPTTIGSRPRRPIIMKFSMTGQEKGELLIHVTALAGLIVVVIVASTKG